MKFIHGLSIIQIRNFLTGNAACLIRIAINKHETANRSIYKVNQRIATNTSYMTMKMKNWWLLLPLLAFGGCIKDSKYECVATDVNIMAPAAEVAALKGYLSGNGITTTEDPRGFFYKMNVTGTGATPNTCSRIGLDYVAKLLNGTTVDSNNNVLFPVNAFIAGWQEALPLMNAGSEMTLYLPPSLAYGSTANGNVPANSNMIFQIKLKSVQ